MLHNARSIRTFIGAKNYTESKAFYRDLGFIESVISDKMSYFKVNDSMGFYLQDYYVKDWINNSMIFLEVDDLDRYWTAINQLDLPNSYPRARLSSIKSEDWGKEFFLHDPAGVLWHFGIFF